MNFQKIFPTVELTRFVVVGGVCFMASFASLYLFTDIVGLHYMISMCITVVLVNFLGWLLNRLWTFRSNSIHTREQILRYFVVNLFAFGITLAVAAVLVSGFGIHYLVANAIVAILMMLVNFVAHKNWSFNDSR